MINADLEVQRLRNKLHAANIVDRWQIDNICDSVSNKIDQQTQDIVTSAMQQAVEYATEIGADRFIDEVKIISIGNTFKIVTVSGDLDYSEDAIKNLPNLLKGRDSRVIPITDTKTTRKTNLMDMMSSVSKSVEKYNQMSLSADASPSCFDLTKNLVSQMNARKILLQKTKQQIGQTRFRTASKNQDPNVSWVIPKRNLDMTDFINNLNADMESQIDEVIQNEINTVMRML